MKITISAIIILVALYFTFPTSILSPRTSNDDMPPPINSFHFGIQQAKGAYSFKADGQAAPITNMYFLHLGPFRGFYFVYYPGRVIIASLISTLAIASIFYFMGRKRIPESTPVQQ